MFRYVSSTGSSHFHFQGTSPTLDGRNQVKPRKGHSRELPLSDRFEMSTSWVRVYSCRNRIRTSICRDKCGGKLNCCVSWHCMVDIPGLHVYRLTQGHRGEWVSVLSYFPACFKTRVTKPSCFVCSADKDTTLCVCVCVCVCVYAHTHTHTHTHTHKTKTKKLPKVVPCCMHCQVSHSDESDEYHEEANCTTDNML